MPPLKLQLQVRDQALLAFDNYIQLGVQSTKVFTCVESVQAGPFRLPLLLISLPVRESLVPGSLSDSATRQITTEM